VVANDLTKKFELFQRGLVSELAAWAKTADIRGEYVVLIGGAEK